MPECRKEVCGEDESGVERRRKVNEKNCFGHFNCNKLYLIYYIVSNHIRQYNFHNNKICQKRRTMPSELRDDKGNIATIEYWGSIEKASASLLTLKDCSNCLNCFNCLRCRDCEECNNCSDCFACRKCSICCRCTICIGSNYCSKCDYCDNCVHCTDCDNSLNSQSCFLSSNCVNCSNCSYCYKCEECSICSNCEDCKKCSNCYLCFNSSELYTKAEIKGEDNESKTAGEIYSIENQT